MESIWPGSWRSLEPVTQAIANYVANWSLNSKNTYKRIIENGGKRGVDMTNILNAARNATAQAQTIKPQYPAPVGIPNDIQTVLQMVRKIAV